MSNWPHAPSHEVSHPGAYILTSGTYAKSHLFNTPEKLSMLETALLSHLEDRGWQVQAWAVFANHYHVVGLSPETGLGLTELTKSLHAATANELNQLDQMPGRQVWYRSWDTRLTYPKSYLSRLAYVHTNPVKHQLVTEAENYRWCSAEWFRLKSEGAFFRTGMSFKTDRLNVIDDF